MAFIAIMTGRRRAVLLQHDEVFDEEGWRMDGRQNLEGAKEPNQPARN
jgi:hypothetical protein